MSGSVCRFEGFAQPSTTYLPCFPTLHKESRNCPLYASDNSVFTHRSFQRRSRNRKSASKSCSLKCLHPLARKVFHRHSPVVEVALLRLRRCVPGWDSGFGREGNLTLVGSLGKAPPIPTATRGRLVGSLRLVGFYSSLVRPWHEMETG